MTAPTDILDSVAIHFAQLFAGRTDARGTGDGYIEREPVTLDHYRRHLAGVGSGLGIFPVRDDGTVRFGAVDLDEPDFDLAEEMQAYIPGASFLERSRSGNAHVWVFYEGDTPAWAVRALLRGATQAVGRPEVEVFPKQDRIREGGVGNFINLPYHGDDRPILDDARMYMKLDRFLFHAHEGLQNPDSWVRRARSLGAVSPEEREQRRTPFGTQASLHQCAAYIYEHRHSNPIQEGGRQVVMFHIAKQLLNWAYLTDGEAWGMLEEINDAAQPPLSRVELERAFENAREGQYTFTGCDDPLMEPYVDPECPIAKGEVSGSV